MTTRIANSQTDPHVEWYRRCCEINDEINADPENDPKAERLLYEFGKLERQLIEEPAISLAGLRAQVDFLEMEFGRYLNDVAPSEPRRILKTFVTCIDNLQANAQA